MNRLQAWFRRNVGVFYRSARPQPDPLDSAMNRMCRCTVAPIPAPGNRDAIVAALLDQPLPEGDGALSEIVRDVLAAAADNGWVSPEQWADDRDWGAAHDAEVKAQALEEAAQPFWDRLPDGTGNGRAYNSHRVAYMLRDQAAQIRAEASA